MDAIFDYTHIIFALGLQFGAWPDDHNDRDDDHDDDGVTNIA